MGSWDRLRPGGDVSLAAVGRLIDLWTGGDDDGLLWFMAWGLPHTYPFT